MANFKLSKIEIKEKFEELTSLTGIISIKLFEFLTGPGVKQLDNCEVIIFSEKNMCSFFLNSIIKEEADFKIDIYDKYFDLFVNDEEIVIQQKILPIENSLELIQNYLKSKIIEEVFKSKKNITLRKTIKFYLNKKKINSVGSILAIPYLFKNKHKIIIEYAPWVYEPRNFQTFLERGASSGISAGGNQGY